MAVIGKIRSYSGLLIAVIGIALVAFVLGDFMGYGPAGTRETEVASVGNTKIMYQEFENRVAQQTEQWKQQTGNQSLSSAEAFQVRQQVYNQMIREIVMNREFEEIGISVSGDELTDLIIGNDPHPSIIQSFTNPQDGSFDPQTVVEFIQNMDMMEPEMQNQWIQLEDYIKQETKESKFHNLISKGFYAPDTIAFLDHQFKNTTATVNLLVKRYNTIADSLVNVSDSDLRRVYDEHKYQFENDEETRDLEYVVFPVFPSEDDREIIKQEIETLKQEMLEAEDKISFINANSDQRFDPTFYSQDELSPEIDSIMFNSEPGEVYGPYEEEDSYVVALLNDIQFRPDSMQASHILIAYVGSQSAGEETVLTREQAEETADSLLAVVRQNPGSFAQIASEMSDDPSAEMNQGDLGWFQDGDMVAPFND
ncbi:MAG: peptidylprolyl isomerase, partial [Bacteroidota bacterium]